MADIHLRESAGFRHSPGHQRVDLDIADGEFVVLNRSFGLRQIDPAAVDRRFGRYHPASCSSLAARSTTPPAQRG